MKTTEKLNTLQEAHRIADEMRRFGKAVGYSWAFDTVRWLLRDATPDGMMVSSDGNNTETARYFFRERTW